MIEVMVFFGIPIGMMFGLHLGVAKDEHRAWQRAIADQHPEAKDQAAKDRPGQDGEAAAKAKAKACVCTGVKDRLRTRPSRLDGLAIALDACELVILLGAYASVTSASGSGGGGAIDVATVCSVAAVVAGLWFTLQDSLRRDPDAWQNRALLACLRFVGVGAAPASKVAPAPSKKEQVPASAAAVKAGAGGVHARASMHIRPNASRKEEETRTAEGAATATENTPAVERRGTRRLGETDPTP